MQIYIILIALLCAHFASCVPDTGQFDALVDIKRTAEYKSVARVGLDPVVNPIAHGVLTDLVANPVALDDLEINLFALVPAFADWFFFEQTLKLKDMSPPLFDIEHLLGALARLRQDPTVVIKVFSDILECALPKHPDSLHALSNHGPVEVAGTLLYCRGMQLLVPEVLGDDWIYDMRDFAPQCEGPPRAARNERLRIKIQARPRRLCEIEQGFMVAFMSSLQAEGFKLGAINLGGGIARDLAGAPGLDGVDLVSDSVYSKLFGQFVLQSYHPAIMMNTRFPELRTLLLIRLAILIHRLAVGWTVEDIFKRAAELFRLDVYDYLPFLAHAGLDASDILFFAQIGWLIKQWVNKHTRGTRSFSGTETADASLVVDAAKVCDAMRELGDVELHGLLVSTGFCEDAEEVRDKDDLEKIYDEHRTAIISRFPLTQAPSFVSLTLPSYQTHLERHLKTHVAKEERKVLCTYPDCGKMVVELQAHLKTHVAKEEREVLCTYPGCGQMVVNLQAHLKTHVAKEERKVLCTYPGCGKMVVRLEDHLKKTHVPKEEREVLCTYPGCGKAVVYLQLHLKAMHGL
ncbi:hypothetical protein JCM9279_000872 [Rhodotorula babjevae]